ncbi:hypothetical protein [Leucobacter sp. OH1287]|uniref:hypothetical protein n=1 Tax=Leucobacter sp. OH1287 TaxID=2491049 RepID=UPI000F5D8D19|nr:hypothetical protein [Leucobacter sp. OH1287]RRD60208.1 hypothetical protein EII30_06510 [Leucobacter sp. OH1287]
MSQAQKQRSTQALPQLHSSRQQAAVAKLAQQPLRTRAERPNLRLVAQAKRKPKSILMPTLCVLASAVILGLQLMLSILSQQDAYELNRLSGQQRDLNRVSRVLEQSVEALNSPQNLAENAVSLGMVQNAQPAYLRLSDGTMIGDPKVAAATPQANTVSNAMLSQVPVIDESGLALNREAQLSAVNPAADQGVATNAPTEWEGELPAPNTH